MPAFFELKAHYAVGNGYFMGVILNAAVIHPEAAVCAVYAVGCDNISFIDTLLSYIRLRIIAS